MPTPEDDLLNTDATAKTNTAGKKSSTTAKEGDETGGELGTGDAPSGPTAAELEAAALRQQIADQNERFAAQQKQFQDMLDKAAAAQAAQAKQIADLLAAAKADREEAMLAPSPARGVGFAQVDEDDNDDDDDTDTFVVNPRQTVTYHDTTYGPGELIELDRAEGERLLAGGAVRHPLN